MAGATRGSRRWIELSFFRFQPSELGKVLLILALSAFIIDRLRRLGERETTSRIMLLALLPTLLVMAQPDLGTSIVYVTIALALLFVAGHEVDPLRRAGGLAAAAAVLVLVIAPAAGVPLLKDYQKDRLTAFLRQGQCRPLKPGLPAQPGRDRDRVRPQDRPGHRSARRRRGWTSSPRAARTSCSRPSGELYGFVGAGIVLSLYALLIWRSLRILTIAKNLYGALLAAGVGAMLMTQVFVNVGGNVGIMPITGIPLPLMSYGGSSVIVTLIALGILQSVYVQAKEAAASKPEVLA